MAFLGMETFAQKGIFVLYLGLWVNFGLLNQLAKKSHVEFNGTTAVLMQSLLKIVLSCYMFLIQDGTGKKMMKQAVEHRGVFLLYSIPASLYAVYDVLAYVNLKHFDPSTYVLLLQSRLPVTAIIHQVMFKTRLNRNQWIAVLITTAGCALKTVGDTVSIEKETQPSAGVYGLLAIQILCSVFAGVYNELLLKKRPSIPLNLQNIFMYLNSVASLVAMLSLGLTGQTLTDAIKPENIRVMVHPIVLALVLIMSFVGIVTSVFLKLLDSVRKSIAGALELVALPIFSALLFRIPIAPHMFFSVAMVSSGMYLYSVPVTVPANVVSEEELEPLEPIERGGRLTWANCNCICYPPFGVAT